MGKLAEYLRAEADTIRRERDRRRKALAEWLAILDDLFGRLDGWLAASDPEGLLERAAGTVELWDPALGSYPAPSRRITVGDKSVTIAPAARYIAWPIRPPGVAKPVRAHGLVEVRDPGQGRVYLFQLPEREWYIKSGGGNINVTENPVEPLDADRFEAALASLIG
ncbi:MAG: hypothetical protein K2X87_18385 [Gemmataceae bacterium]|nr:hypothetical protein [Gemmataceae bacterium]